MKSGTLVERFNKRFPIGAKVQWRSIGKDDVPFEEVTVKSAAFDSHGQAVVFFEERSGYCSIDPRFVNYGKGRTDGNH